MSADYSKITETDLDLIREYLKREKLCYEDIGKPNIFFRKMFDKNKILGFFGLEIYGSDALLRSVVVLQQGRLQGIGRQMMQQAMRLSAENGILNLYLLTFSAAGFFEKLGFKVIDRNAVPDLIAKTEEFTKFCPDTAVCMTKKLEYGN
jgi:amino-acid N-acetyltransferase